MRWQVCGGVLIARWHLTSRTQQLRLKYFGGLACRWAQPGCCSRSCSPNFVRSAGESPQHCGTSDDVIAARPMVDDCNGSSSVALFV